MPAQSSRSAEYFDGWYADMVRSPAKDAILQRHLGLPPHVLSTSHLPWEGIAEAVDVLGLSPGDLLLDLACGRGGLGLELAARTRARLVGVDFSGEALRQARTLAARLGQTATFQQGGLTATGLATGSVDAVLCVDSIQFAEDPQAAYRELRRVLVPGGRVMLTSWQPVEPGDDRVSFRIRRVDPAGGLTAAGFENVVVSERRDWRERERATWEEAVGLDPGDDPALRSFRDEGLRHLQTFDLLRRVMATARAPLGVGSSSTTPATRTPPIF